MPATVQLNHIIDALEMQFDEHVSYLDLDTGQVETVPEELLRDAEEDGDEGPDLPDWQDHEWEIAKRIVSTGRFIPLPTKFDVHEWAIMEEFSLSIESDSVRNESFTRYRRHRGIPNVQGHRSTARDRTSVVCIPCRCP